MNTYFKKTVAVICVIGMLAPSIVVLSYPQPAEAGTGVEIGTTWDFNNIMDHLKNFSLDLIATTVAKQILHQLTASVVDWINTGFQGSPSFLNNPKSFFLDAADQVTGVFLNESTSPLKNLCGRLGLDLTLALAYGQVSPINARYTCTLGKIFNNVKNLPDNISIQGKSLNSFMKGDFSQGGWKGFISISQSPKNNASGAYLQAHGDLLQAIGVKKNALDQQLLQGHGFLSWQSCNGVSGDGAESAVNDVGLDLTDLTTNAYANKKGQSAIDIGNGSSVQATVNSNGGLDYKTCETQTPGSVISGQVEKSLGVPATELELANNINAVINALVTQLISSLISGGLGSLSKSGSGGKQSATRAVIASVQQKQAELEGTITLTGSNNTVASIKTKYDSAVNALTTSKTNYLAARSCFANKPLPPGQAQTYAAAQIATIDDAINGRLNPLLNSMLAKQANLAAALPQIQNTAGNSVTDAQTLDALNAQFNTLSDSIAANNSVGSALYQNSIQSNNNNASSTTAGIATQDLQTAQSQATAFNGEASQFQNLCNNL